MIFSANLKILLCQCLGELGDLYWFTAAKLPYFLWAKKDAGSEQFAVFVCPFVDFVFYLWFTSSSSG
jgi:hypothetical protein